MFYITYPGSNGLNLVLDIYPEDLYNADPYPGSKQLQKIILKIILKKLDSC